MDDARLFALLDQHAPWRPTSLVPSLSAWHADDELPLWQALEAELSKKIDPPFFAVAWPGAQGLARAIEDGVVDVKGKHVVDVGAGSGIASAAVARAGACVTALDVDALAVTASVELARRNGAAVEARVADALQHPREVGDVDVILAGDLVYGEALHTAWARALATWRAEKREVIVADSGRPFFDPAGLTRLIAYDVDTPRVLDGKAKRTVTVYRAS